jgi:hypothetical protein
VNGNEGSDNVLRCTMNFEFRPNPNFKAELKKAAIEAVQKIKCPKHGTEATVMSEEPLKLQFCYQELAEKVKAEANS